MATQSALIYQPELRREILQDIQATVRIVNRSVSNYFNDSSADFAREQLLEQVIRESNHALRTSIREAFSFLDTEFIDSICNMYVLGMQAAKDSNEMRPFLELPDVGQMKDGILSINKQLIASLLCFILYETIISNYGV